MYIRTCFSFSMHNGLQILDLDKEFTAYKVYQRNSFSHIQVTARFMQAKLIIIYRKKPGEGWLICRTYIYLKYI